MSIRLMKAVKYKVNWNICYRNLKIKILLINNSPPGEPEPKITVCIVTLAIRENVTYLV